MSERAAEQEDSWSESSRARRFVVREQQSKKIRGQRAAEQEDSWSLIRVIKKIRGH